jgi:competence ComEA-like helix-hairpin-helix protein
LTGARLASCVGDPGTGTDQRWGLTSHSLNRDRPTVLTPPFNIATSFNGEDRMLRTLLSIVALSVFVIAHPGAAGAAQAPSGGRAAAKGAIPATVNINTASAKELDALPGIGAKTAALIVEYRQKNGPFKKIEEILETSSSCPYLLTKADFCARRSVSRSR